MWQDVVGQSFKDYLWPDVKTLLGKRTALFEGGVASLMLAIIYSVRSILLYKNGATLPEEVAGVIDVNLYVQIKMLLNLICVGTAVFYIRSVAKSENKTSIVFLLLWAFFEVYSEYTSGLSIMLVVYLILFLFSLNASRTMGS